MVRSKFFRAIIRTFSATVLIGNAESCTIECPDDWSEFNINGKPTCLINTGVSAISAGAHKCASGGYRQPLPLNQQENVDFRAAFDALGASHVGLDVTDVHGEGQWRDAYGTAVGYFNWYPGEPNNSGNEDFVGMLPPSHHGKWNDYQHSYQVHIVCQQAKPECCTADDIVLECSPDKVELSVPRCFYEQQGIKPSTIFVGEDAGISACQGALVG